METVYEKWIKHTTTSEMNLGFLEHLVELRDGKENPQLLDSFASQGILAVPNEEFLYEHLNEMGITLEDINYTKDEWFRLSGGFIIPVWSANKEFLFAINYDKERGEDPNVNSGKYVNAFPTKRKEALKSMRIYGLENTEKAIEQGVIFLVEGALDKCRLESTGLPVITTMGSKLNTYQIRVLKRFKKIVNLSDNDRAGNEAKLNLIHKLKLVNIEKIPYGAKDIDDLAKENPEKFTEFINYLTTKYVKTKQQ